MVILRPLFTHLFSLQQRWRQLTLLLCLVLAAFPALMQAKAVWATADQPAHRLYQSSVLSPLQQPITTTSALTGSLETTTPMLDQGNPTSLVLVALVLLGLVSVIGFVLWRPR